MCSAVLYYSTYQLSFIRFTYIIVAILKHHLERFQLTQTTPGLFLSLIIILFVQYSELINYGDVKTHASLIKRWQGTNGNTMTYYQIHPQCFSGTKVPRCETKTRTLCGSKILNIRPCLCLKQITFGIVFMNNVFACFYFLLHSFIYP